MLKKLIDWLNYLSPMIIIGLTLFALARTVTRSEVEAIFKNLQAKDAEHDQTLEAIKAGMTEEQWQKATETLKSLNSLKHSSTP